MPGNVTPLPDIGAVVESVVALARSRPGRLVAITVQAPNSTPPQVVEDHLRAALDACHAGQVQITARPSHGPLRLLSAEFAR